MAWRVFEKQLTMQHLLPVLGHDHRGVRLYYLPGDTATRYQRDSYLADLAEGADRDPLYECPECHECTTLDWYDVIGADPGKLFCGYCGAEVEVTEVTA